MTASEGQAEGRGTAATLVAARGRQVCMGGIFVCVRLCQVGRNQSLSGVCCGAWRNTRGSVLVKQRPMHPQPSAIFSGPPPACTPAPASAHHLPPPKRFALMTMPVVPSARNAPIWRLCDLQASRMVHAAGRSLSGAHHTAG